MCEIYCDGTGDVNGGPIGRNASRITAPVAVRHHHVVSTITMPTITSANTSTDTRTSPQR